MQLSEPMSRSSAVLQGAPASAARRHEMPFVRLEAVVLSLVDDRLQVLLARRAEPPRAGRWGLPGGVLRIDLDASLDAAARRVMHERLGGELPFLRQLVATGGPGRDPRAPWTLAVVYRALVPQAQVPAVAGKRVAALAWQPVEAAMADARLAFDHAALVAQAVQATRDEAARLVLPAGFLPEAFALGELQTLCEQLLGHALDKSSFRRKLADRALVEPIAGAVRSGANRPAQLYRWAAG